MVGKQLIFLRNHNCIIHHHNHIFIIVSNIWQVLLPLNIIYDELKEIHASTIGVKVSTTKSGIDLR